MLTWHAWTAQYHVKEESASSASWKTRREATPCSGVLWAKLRGHLVGVARSGAVNFQVICRRRWRGMRVNG